MLDSKIETFINVIKYKSYTLAAEKLHMTQPAVTQHIHKLESYYGCLLIDSSRHTVKPTQAGMLLYEYLRLQKANEERFSHLLHNAVEPLCVGATLSIADYYLPDLLADYMLSGSGRIRVTVGNTASLLDMLQRGTLDCAFIEGLFNTTMLETRVFQNAPFLPVVSQNHPLIEATLPMLHKFPLVLREPHSGTREILENWLHQENDAPQAFSHVVELGSFVLIKEFVKRSDAVTFVYEGVVRRELKTGELRALSLKNFSLTHPLLFVFRKGDPRRSHLMEFFDAFRAADTKK